MWSGSNHLRQWADWSTKRHPATHWCCDWHKLTVSYRLATQPAEQNTALEVKWKKHATGQEDSKRQRDKACLACVILLWQRQKKAAVLLCYSCNFRVVNYYLENWNRCQHAGTIWWFLSVTGYVDGTSNSQCHCRILTGYGEKKCCKSHCAHP